jgi:hypothetical protein
METLLIKVDTKENKEFLRELVHKFSFVLEVKSNSPENPVAEIKNVEGSLHAFSEQEKSENIKASAVDFVNKWTGFLKVDDVEKAKLDYLLEKYK